MVPFNGQLATFTWGFGEKVQWGLNHRMRMDNMTASYDIGVSDYSPDNFQSGWLCAVSNPTVKSISASPFIWHTYGFHYESISDQMYDTFDGKSNTYPIIHRGDVVNSDRFGTSLTIGNRPYRPPLSYFDDRRPFHGDISCFLMYDRGMSPVESKLAKQRWCFHPEYAGCYKMTKMDGAKFNFSHQLVVRGHDMSLTACRRACHHAGTAFASVQAGKVCNCWNSLPTSSIAEASTDCDAIVSGAGEAGSTQDPTTTLSIYRTAMTRRVNGIKIYRNIHLGKSFPHLIHFHNYFLFHSDCPYGWQYNYHHDICYAKAPTNPFVVGLAYCNKFGQSGQMSVGGSRDEAVLMKYVHESSTYFQQGCWTNDWSDPVCTNHFGQLLLDYQHIDLRKPRYIGSLTRPIWHNGNSMNLGYFRFFHEYSASGSICQVASPQIDGL